MTARAIMAAALMLASVASRGQDAAAGAKERPRDVEFVWGLEIPMRDGVKLSGLLLRPLGAKDPLPVILHLTPYTTNAYLQHGLYLAGRGFAFVSVDVRGRGNSEGTFEPIANDGRDGHDAVEWLARQPWSAGKVGMWGGSYAGFDQWSTLKEGPPHLATVAPAASVYPSHDFPRYKNVSYPYLVQWITYVSGRTAQLGLFAHDKTWDGLYRAHYHAHRPFADLDQFIGNPSPIFQRWLQHPTPDAYWDAMVPSAEQYARMSVPILTITGHYDDDQPGALRYYREHMRYGRPEARERHFLVMGPWEHFGTRSPKREVGGFTFGEASLVDLNAVHAQWYDWTLRGGPRPEFLKKRVAYYVSGPEEWRYADDLDAISSGKRVLYLHSRDGQAADAFHSGTLSPEKPERQRPDRYTYDPLDVRPAELEAEDDGVFPRLDRNLVDQRFALQLFGAGLVYHSDPLPEEVEIVGQPRVRAWISMDVPDTDIEATLYQVMPNGSSLLLGRDVVRARFRESARREKLVKPGEVLSYEFGDFNWVARRLRKGSRLRLTIGAPNSIYAEKNFNGGGVVWEESGKDARTAHVTLFHEPGLASFLELPVATVGRARAP